MKWKIVAVIFIVLGTITLSSFTFLQQSNLQHNLVFYTEGKHDALWHLALMSALKRSIPPQNPLIGDKPITGYHYFNDVVWVVVHIVTGIPLVTLYLKVTPVLLAYLFTVTTVLLFLKIFQNKNFAFLGASIVVFGSGFSYLAPIFFPNSKVGLSVFWLDQSIHLGINQQLLLSLAVFNIILWLFFTSYHKHWKAIGILAGLIIAIKIYAGLVLLGILLAMGLYRFLKKKERVLLKTFGLAFAISIPLVLVIGSGGGFPFIWEPGWFFKTMFESGDRLNYPKWEQIRVDAVMNHSWHRLIILWFMAIGIFFVGNFGLKIIGFLTSLFVIHHVKKEDKVFWQILLLILIFCFAMPTLFLQKGVVWNTLQFLPYTFIPLTLFLTKTVELLKLPIRWQITLLTFVLLISLPSTLYAFHQDLDAKSYSVLSIELVKDIQLLGSQYPDKKILLSTNLQHDSLIPAFAGRAVFFTNQAVLSLMGDRYEQRRTYIEDVQLGRTKCTLDEIFVTLVNKTELYVEECPRKLHTVILQQ